MKRDERDASKVSTKIFLSDDVRAQIAAHGAETYPHECCGALLGRDGEAAREVTALFALVNRREDSPRNRFAVTAEDVRAAERAAQGKGLEVLGWYHSHPDHPAQPSEYDREHAWPWYSYVIASVMSGTPQEMTSWRLTDDLTTKLKRSFNEFDIPIWIDSTPDLSGDRAEEVEAWIQTNGPCIGVILDDDCEGFERTGLRCVESNVDHGLTDDLANDVISALNQQ